jgi:cob(I)alamin adenosyltransferase
VSARRPAIRHSAVATGKGDDGTTGLLFGGPKRIAKDDPRTEAYGTIDETVAALGLARAELQKPARGTDASELADLILRFQRELFVVGAELATDPADRGRLEDGVSMVSEAMLDALEATLASVEARVTMPREFVVPGETRASAAIELARAILRRAERRAVALTRDGSPGGKWLLPYVNRLADLLWVLARLAEQSESKNAPPSRAPPSRTPRSRA